VVRRSYPVVGDRDDHFFNEGTHQRLGEVLGAQLATHDGRDGTAFAVWAPAARAVTVMGDFDGWRGEDHPMVSRGDSGIWQAFVPDVEVGTRYKYRIHTADGRLLEKADPVALRTEVSPSTASIVCDLDYEWGDGAWMAERERRNALDAPISVYEVHLGSWRRPADDPARYLTYQESARLLAEHCHTHGFTHVELLPVMEHPFYGSWGYQTTGYFAPTSRYGAPQGLMELVDVLHQAGIGVLLDWVPSHFASDDFGLARFDGTHCYEHADPKQGYHPDWGSCVFNYGRHEVRSFLLSNASFWLDRYHVDGLRVDAVASMLYLDYSRVEGEWVPNRYGGRENLEALDFLRMLNKTVYERFPGAQTFAEESTAWPMVSRPTYLGGLGFGFKWDMGWMHDTLGYFARDPVHRRWHHHELTFRGIYQFQENFVLPLSHDEVVHGKGSLLSKMPGDAWQQRANLRLLLGEMTAQPGKKLLFMGSEFGQWHEWDHDSVLDWPLLDDPAHAGISRWVGDCNRLYREHAALHELDCDPAGFEWVEADDSEHSVLAFLRRGRDPQDAILVVANHTPVPWTNHRIGVDREGRWRELLNSDAELYGGAGWGNFGAITSAPVPAHGREFSLVLTLPPLAVLFLRWDGPRGA